MNYFKNFFFFFFFFDLSVKKKQEAYEKLIEMSGNNDYATVTLLNYFYH